MKCIDFYVAGICNSSELLLRRTLLLYNSIELSTARPMIIHSAFFTGIFMKVDCGRNQR